MRTNLSLWKILALALVFAGCVAGDVGEDKSAAGASAPPAAPVAPTNPSIAAVAPASGGSSFTNDPNVNFSVSSLNNPSSVNVTYRWFVNGAQHIPSNGLTIFGFDPDNNPTTVNALLGANNITVQVVDVATSIVYDSFNWNWTVNIVQPTFNLASGLPGALSDSIATPFPAGAANISRNIQNALEGFSVNVNNPGGVTFFVTWFVESTLIKTTSTSADPYAASQNFDYHNVENLSAATPVLNVKSSNGYHIRVVLSSATGGTGTVYGIGHWEVDVSLPDLTPFDNFTLSFPGPGTTSIHAVDDQIYTAGNTWFRNGTATSRGTAISSVAPDDFCIQVDDVTGTGGPNTSITFFRVDGGGETQISNNVAFPANNTDVCLAANLLAPGAFNFDLANGPSQNIRARVYDSGEFTLPIGTSDWVITVEERNTPPSIANDTTCTNCTATLTPTVAQATAVAFGVTVQDKDGDPSVANDFSITYRINGTIINTANNYPGTTTAMPDCEHVTGDAVGVANGATFTKYVCNLSLPAFGTAGSIAPTAYTITADVNDNTTFGAGPQASNTVTWTVTTTETNTAPVIASVVEAGACPGTPTPAANTYVHQEGNNTACIISAVEDTVAPNEGITINVAVSDAERDDYNLTIQLENPNSLTTFNTIYGPVLINRTDATDPVSPGASKFTYTIPQSYLNAVTLPGNSQAINVRIIVDDVPDVAGTLQDVEDISITLNNSNPIPVNGGGQNPAFAADEFLTKGGHFQINSGTITDASTGGSDGAVIRYQWQYSTTAGCAGGTFIDIPTATSKDLNWTAPNALDGSTVCFRLCLGDDGFGNDPTSCATGNIIGPWVGSGGNGIVTVREADTTVGTVNAESATYVDPGTGVFYVATTQASNLIINRYAVNPATGAVTATTTGPIATESATSDPARNISMTGDSGSDSLYVSYIVDDDDLLPPSVTPVVRIRRVNLSDVTLGQQLAEVNVVAGGVGKIVTNGTNWYVPFIEVGNGNRITVLSDPVGATFTGPTQTQLTTTTTASTAVMNVMDTVNNDLIMGIKDTSGLLNMKTYNTAIAMADATTSTANDAFSGTLFNLSDMSVGGAGNPTVYVAGQNTSNQLMIAKFASNGLTSPSFTNNISGGVVPEFTGFTALAVTANTTADDLLVGVSHGTDAHIVKVSGVTPTATAADVSNPINAVASSVTSSGLGTIAMSAVEPNFDNGQVTLGDADNNTVFFTFYATTQVHVVQVNVEQEAAVNAHNGAGGGGWDVPFFQ